MSGERLQDHWSSGILFKCHHNPGLALTNFMARSNFVTFNIYIYPVKKFCTGECLGQFCLDQEWLH